MPFNLTTDDIIRFIQAHQHLAPLVIFLLSMGETIVIVSVFIPSTILLIAIGGLMAASGVPLIPSLIAGWLGATLGFSLMYLLSATLQGRILTAWPFRKYPEIVARAQDFMLKWGVLGVIIGHFAGPLRVVIPIAAGISRMPPVPFMLANLVGALAWICVFFAPSYLLVSSDWFATTFSGLKAMLPLPAFAK